ncbi:hypothetical protein ASD62_01970 [Phycicoccus sp. Root563]|nr:hypothetical protein ASC58_08820 [Phycicoccus sp. Root101]KQZ88273.1 hypothetical protein ASD62_01970 [Phycicoccus sp. Root563]
MFGSLGRAAVVELGDAVVDDVPGARVVVVADVPLALGVPPGRVLGLPVRLVAVPSEAPAEQEAVSVTARAAAVTAASGRMSAECRSP